MEASTPRPRAHSQGEKKKIYQGIEEILSKSDIPENIITYIDDVLIHSGDHIKHLQQVEEALKRLRQAHLRLNVGKCIFGATSVQYLGHTLTAKGVKPGKDKTAAIREVEPPRTLKQLKAFLGLANYFRSFIPSFAKIAAPLFALTRKETVWKNTTLPEEAITAFETIKRAITSEPVMAFPTRTGKYTLITDGAAGDAKSGGGLGAVLLQRQATGENRPVGYASRQLLKYEHNYPPFLLEMAAAVFGMDYFHHYLVGRRFNLLTDHKPLVPLSTTHTKTLNRLQLKMQDMHPDVGYIPGEDNVIGDFLSRYQGMDANVHEVACAALTHVDGVGIASVDLSPQTILGAQRLSPLVREAADMLKKAGHRRGDKPLYFPPLRQNITWMPDSWCIGMVPNKRKGIITPTRPLPVIPQSLRKGILREAHNSALGGHNGTFRTTEMLKQMLWWPSMDKEIAQHISQCAVCGANPPNKKQKQGPLEPLPIPDGPHQRIHIDLFGPLKTSDKGNKYVLVWTDALTRMTKLKAIKDKTATSVAEALLDIIYATGVPKQIHSDQGLEFCNELLQHIYTALDIEHTTTSPYHPQCNAAAERFNRTMASFLTKALADAQRSTLDWELYLGPLQLSYNSGVNRSTRMSPFYATFGFNPTLPMWQGLEGKPVTNHTYAEALTKIHHVQGTARRICRENSQAEQLRATKDRNAQDYPEFKRLDTVWVHINAKTGPNPKFAKTHEPGIIVECLGHNVFKVLRYNRSRKKRATLNISHIRKRTAFHDKDDHFKDVLEMERQQQQDQKDEQDTENSENEEETDSEEDHTDRDGETESEDDNDQNETEEEQPQIKGRKRTTRMSDQPERRRSPRLIARASAIGDAAVQELAHLIPRAAQQLPFLEAVAFIPPEMMDFNLVLELVQKGWVLGMSTGVEAQARHQNPPRRPRSSRPSLAMRRLANHNAAGESEQETGQGERKKKKSTLTKMKKLGKEAKNIVKNKIRTIGTPEQKTTQGASPQHAGIPLQFD